jgi:hypothetical protein
MTLRLTFSDDLLLSTFEYIIQFSKILDLFILFPKNNNFRHQFEVSIKNKPLRKDSTGLDLASFPGRIIFATSVYSMR